MPRMVIEAMNPGPDTAKKEAASKKKPHSEIPTTTSTAKFPKHSPPRRELEIKHNVKKTTLHRGPADPYKTKSQQPYFLTGGRAAGRIRRGAGQQDKAAVAGAVHD